MPSKKCFRCLAVKPLLEFYKHPKMPDGYLNKCKTCACLDAMQNRARKLTNPEWLRNERSRCRKKMAKARREGTASPPSRDVQREYYRRNRKKKYATVLVRRAMLKGLIKKPLSCSCCKRVSSKIHAHHFDYSKPLDVIWLCPPCHGFQHWKDNQIAQPINRPHLNANH